MKSRTFVAGLAVLLLLITACSRIYGPVKELDTLIAAKDDVLSQWAQIIDKEASEESIANCRKVLEAKKADLIAKREAVDAAPRGINSDWLTKWMDSKISDEKIIFCYGTEIQ